MPKTTPRIPSVGAIAHTVLADLLTTPISMRPDRLQSTIRDLFAIVSGGPTAAAEAQSQLAAAVASMEDSCDDEEWPWEEPIYEVTEDGIARVMVTGPIVKGVDPILCWWWGLMSTDRLQEALAEIANDANIRVVFLRINSPGGASIGMPEAADQILALDQLKPTFAFTSDLACSNGYRLAAACRGIITTRSAVLGSIGVYIALYDYSEYLKELGIKLELFRVGTFKGIGIMGKEITDEERTFLQDSVDRAAKVFKDLIRAQRPDVKEETMQGQWFDGEQAIALGLADFLVGSEAEALADIRAGLAS